MATRTAERTEFLSDIIVGAIEGGTGYWAQVHQYQYMMDGELRLCFGRKKIADEGTRATVQEIDDASGEFSGDIHVINAEVIARGLSRIKTGECRINSRIAINIMRADRENDAGNIDADDADCIVQAGLFGELVYG